MSTHGSYPSKEECQSARRAIGGGEDVIWRCMEKTEAAVVARPQDSPEGTGSHESMKNILDQAGIPIVSTGSCSDKSRSNCTSLDGIQLAVVMEVVNLKEACHCEVVVSGGTETGHASGQYSHGNGYKIDIQTKSSVDAFITSTPSMFTRDGERGNSDGHGGARYTKTNNPKVEYVRESNPSHWDITVKP
jgi:hypothetical protein